MLKLCIYTNVYARMVTYFLNLKLALRNYPTVKIENSIKANGFTFSQHPGPFDARRGMNQKT